MNNFDNTKWNASAWTEEMKTKWQNKMFELGYLWAGFNVDAHNLSSKYYFLNSNKRIGKSDDGHDYFKSHDFSEKQYADAFQELARDNFEEEFDSMFSQNAKLMEESDPNGISQHEAGAKLDNGKVIAASVLGMFANALYAVTEVGTFGANKYTEGGWQHVQDGEKRYSNAGMRHFLKRNIGEEIDQDSELPHLAHEAWNKLAELELYLRSRK